MPFLKLYKLNLWVQGIYTLVTALWPIIHIESFMEISDYKTDRWLVKTVSILLLAIAIAITLAITSKQVNVPISVLALLVAVGMAYVDFYYALNATIRDIYMADGVVEILFAISWVIVLKENFTQRRKVE